METMFVKRIVPKFPSGFTSQDIHTAPVVRGDSSPSQALAEAAVVTTAEDTAQVVTYYSPGQEL